MSSGTRPSRDPVCPFCGTKLNRPAPMVIDAMETGLGGSCAGCAALYLVDPTNKNVGLIMMQTLELAANKLGREMTDMISGDDYEDAVLSYDVRTHRSTGVARGFTDGYGRMYVLKVKKKPE